MRRQTHLLLVLGKAAIDSLRLRPKMVLGTFEIVTTEWRRPPGDGVGCWTRVARKAASRGVGPEPSPPRSERRRTWLAVIPCVTWVVGSECLRVSRGSRHGDNRYGLTGESMSKLFLGDDLLLEASSSSPGPLSSTTMRGSCVALLNGGVNDERRTR